MLPLPPQVREQQTVDFNTGQPWESVKLTALGRTRSIFEVKPCILMKMSNRMTIELVNREDLATHALHHRGEALPVTNRRHS